MRDKILLLIMAILFIQPINSDAKSNKTRDAAYELHIFSSSNLTGNLEPCG